MKNKKMILLCGFAALALSISSCKGDKTANGETAVSETETVVEDEPLVVEDEPLDGAKFVDLDLGSEGLPVALKAPKDAKIIESSTEGTLFVYGGKRFKLTLSSVEDQSVEEYVALLREFKKDPEMNPSFDKFIYDDATGYMAADKDGKLTFTVGVPVGDNCVIIQEGIDFDKSPDQFTDYTAEDVQLMYDAARTAVGY